jgi:hypothetical protein
VTDLQFVYDGEYSFGVGKAAAVELQLGVPVEIINECSTRSFNLRLLIRHRK